MNITVKTLFSKISPRKARPVLYGLRGMTAVAARDALLFTNKKAAKILVGLVKSGIAAAKENYLEGDKVFVKDIYCNEGPRLKRHIPKSKGRTYNLQKRMSHFTLVLSDEVVEISKPSKAKPKTTETKTKEIKSGKINEAKAKNNKKEEK